MVKVHYHATIVFQMRRGPKRVSQLIELQDIASCRREEVKMLVTPRFTQNWVTIATFPHFLIMHYFR